MEERNLQERIGNKSGNDFLRHHKRCVPLKSAYNGILEVFFLFLLKYLEIEEAFYYSFWTLREVE